ncbi:MAG: EF-P lysine aminoacylase EpmA [Patescibacteria group bacterium]
MSSHVLKINENKKNLEKRFFILKSIRKFFDKQNFTEIEAPLIVKYAGQEPNIEPMMLKVHDENGREFQAFLHTSPEYTMKKMLSAGFDKIFFLGKTFRDYESFGGTHNPEFTMIEWYRKYCDFNKIMDDTEGLFKFVSKKLKKSKFKFADKEFFNFINQKWQRVSTKQLFKKYVKVNLDDYLTKEKMAKLCQDLKIKFSKGERFEELFYRIFLEKIEPNLGFDKPTIVYNYPATMAALSRISKKDKRYAERFEVYFKGLELANAYSELTDAQEQQKRLLEEKKINEKIKHNLVDLDKDFLEALQIGLPECAGIALGVDRLVMALSGCEEINNVLTLGMKDLFY